MLFTAANKHGLYRLLQRAVHLVTVQRVELRTEPENFNFIFKRHADDDVYMGVYDALPGVMLYLSHVVTELFNRMQPLDSGSKMAFTARSIFGFHLVQESDEVAEIKQWLSALLAGIVCATCKTPLTFTHHRHPGYGNSPLIDGSGSVDDLAYLYLDLAKIDEIAATYLFLVSDGGGFITGQTIHVNGGGGYY
jgi:hypothetical protein